MTYARTTRNCFLFFLSAAFAANAFGASITQTFNTLPFSAGSESGTYTVTGFNSALGTLTSVSIALSGSETVQLDGTNVSGSSASYSNVGASGTFTATAPTGLSLFSTAFTPVVSGSLPSGSVNAAITSGGLPVSGSSSIVSPPNNLSSFIGGTWSLSVGNTGSVNGACSSPLSCGVEVDGTPTVTVTYGYTATVSASAPEPASFVLLAPALAGAALLRRRKRIADSLR